MKGTDARSSRGELLLTINGWAGSVLRVNLTTGAITTEDTLLKYNTNSC